MSEQSRKWDLGKAARGWFGWTTLSAAMVAYLSYALLTGNSEAKTVLMPDTTSHGHYQIEMACSACHTPMMGVKQDACLQCHEEELKLARDTHPAKKFNDPTNAARLAILDVQKCVTCHREHVPDQTHSMGVTLPLDYCYHCHQDIAEQRPSHAEFAYDSCATAGCHNYHDNSALYENFLKQHQGEPWLHEPEDARVRELASLLKEQVASKALSADDHDAPEDSSVSDEVLTDWASTAHALAGVNCQQCHAANEEKLWSDQLDHTACQPCHKHEAAGFLSGRHGMRLAQGLSPMTPGDARLPMHSDAHHRELSCNSCHPAHRFDRAYAAAEACLQCHQDEHSLAYRESSHFARWKSELEGTAEAGTGVSCATCHMPRMEIDDEIRVQHNQNFNLRPNEKMVRSVCMNCHGVQFTLDSLADPEQVKQCFHGPPGVQVDSLNMVAEWFRAKEESRRRRQQNKSD